jgi:phosphopantothenoylcysteine synthetase/decarboxylase
LKFYKSAVSPLIAICGLIRYGLCPVRCLVTAGPTYEPLDNVRRLTNFSTGRLGSELANSLAVRGHSVTLLLGEQASYRGELHFDKVESFSTTADLENRLRALSTQNIGAVFHAAAVSDFKFGKVWRRSEEGRLSEVRSGKISTREGTLVAELVPTSKIIGRLRDWFPAARLIGWKFEVEGDRSSVTELARRQIFECRTDACVANGPAYGAGFGIVQAPDRHVHVKDRTELFEALKDFLGSAG